MKGTILKCLQEYVQEVHDEATWQQCLEAAGFSSSCQFTLQGEVDEGATLALFTQSAHVLGLSTTQLFDGFGQYWMCYYALDQYRSYYLSAHSSKEFIKKLNFIHHSFTQHLPPGKRLHLVYQWQSEHTLLLEYHSERNLINLLISLVKGVGVYYQEQLLIQKCSPTTLLITFPAL